MGTVRQNKQIINSLNKPHRRLRFYDACT